MSEEKHEKAVKRLAQKQKLTRTLAELEMARQKILDFKSLLHVSGMLNSSLDSHRLLEMIVKTAKEVTQSEGAALLLYDSLKKDLVHEVVFVNKGSFVDQSRRVPAGEGVAGWVVQHHEPICVPDITQDPRFAQLPKEILGLQARSVLAVPMVSHDALLGVLEAVNPSMKRSAPEEAIELFNFFSNEAAVAISNAKYLTEFRQLFLNTVRSLIQALEAKDPYTSGHAQRVCGFALVLARELGVPTAEWENIELSALLHDIGKIGVPEEILNKPAKVTDEEYEEIKKHPEQGVKILAPLEQMGKVLPGIVYHHERWDGTGYPHKLKGEQIPLVARIVSVADALDAMTSTRAYRKALPDEEALQRMEQGSGSQFDPQVVKALFHAYAKGLVITANQASKAA